MPATAFLQTCFFRSINFTLNFEYEIRKKLTRDQAPVVQKVDSAILWLSLYYVDSAILFFLMIIHWIVIYPVDSTIHFLTSDWPENSIICDVLITFTFIFLFFIYHATNLHT